MMIKLNNVNKFFFKGKSNENHVCKNTSLEFEDKGLNVILGSSGSGKTTLLNMMCGMDKFNSGSITFQDRLFTRYKSRNWDKIRNEKIGYIYQNYQLLNDFTVYDNIELVLKMNGISDDVEIAKRVSYLLDIVGMKNYEDRLAKQLSGGQQQRVAFARALSKNPDVIIADEPTGNLDSKTTIELMNILKRISLEKLVIMVTHEQALADFYADRIIEVSNGKVIKDYKNTNTGNLSVIQEQIIYLQDYQKEEVNTENLNLISYTDEEAKKLEKVGVELIQRRDTLFIKVDSKHFRRVKYIDKTSEIELRDEQSDTSKVVDKEYHFEDIINETVEKKKRSVISIKDSFKYAIRKFNKVSYGGKMLYVVLGLMGVIVAISTGLIGQIYNVKDETIVDKHRNYIEVTVRDLSFHEVMLIEDIPVVKQIMFIEDKIEFQIQTEQFYQITNSIEIEAHPVDIIHFDETQLIYGTLPEGYGMIIDVSIADDLINRYADRGIETYEDIINASFKLQTSGQDYFLSDETKLLFPITGIANDYSPTVWMDEQLIYSYAVPTLIDYRILGDNFQVVTGELPSGHQDLMININSSLIRQHEIPSSVGITTGSYDVTGTFAYVNGTKDYDFGNIMITELQYLKTEYFFTFNGYKINYSFLVYTDDPEVAVEELLALGYKAESTYLEDFEVYQDFQFEENASFYLFSIVGIVVSSISIFFIMRSSLLSRVYEVSVYRSLGASKNEIRKMFLVEIILTTTLSSIIGYILMIVLLVQAQSSVAEYVSLVHYPFVSILYGVAGIYIINIVFGLIPINMLLFKTPSEIMTKFDL